MMSSLISLFLILTFPPHVHIRSAYITKTR
nr:MAG TPA: protein of unknown function (DUF4160) [Caudoviricetes sp.]